VIYLPVLCYHVFTAEIDILANQNQIGFLDTLKSFWSPELNRPFLFIMLFFFFWSFATFIPAKPYLIAVFGEIGLPCTAQWTLVCVTFKLLLYYILLTNTYHTIFFYTFTININASFSFFFLKKIHSVWGLWLFFIRIICILGLYFYIDLGRNSFERVDRRQVRQTSYHIGFDGALCFFDARNWNVHAFFYLFLVFVYVDTDDIVERLILLLRLRCVSHSMDVGQWNISDKVSLDVFYSYII